MPRDIKVGDYVEAFGLVGARDLNGKYGEVVAGATSAKSERLAVAFFDKTLTRFTGEPKLLKTTNLKILELNPKKKHPGYLYRDGSERVLVRVEDEKGKKCVDCGDVGYDLGYFVFHGGEYRC
eukprot:CAMPEP_0174886772 /NCGR_PEP_ID=MMETSP0167-20121228/2011_1 /TAXON_ID=38298 /ORGANISM="Rhodella maculata, Strain CCMP736" /LENGTH=122 /DNA_ID=CAMNT_0016122937 /DNA_START=14 /DNA_END=382 /DNA_ORIENTATION=-